MIAFRAILTGFGIIMLGACQRLQTTDFCVLSGVISYSASFDTPETVRQIQEHNALYQELCFSNTRL